MTAFSTAYIRGCQRCGYGYLATKKSQRWCSNSCRVGAFQTRKKLETPMTVYVVRDGKLVDKRTLKKMVLQEGDVLAFPTPGISRMEPFESPITGKEITSWRERDADMKAAAAYDPRDMPKDHRYEKGR